ncbi:hypothetical protein SAMN05443572_104294 [Myxococcus fulvus]|uniref:Uncharacterized protein n=1 Tax=Myxococcus fulvus TaxID=33 RepID=A0A511SYV8_MYXFU|nr:hypothetical protein [Myxococcus fulvus]GEN07081.1 hypothetical protein MFU01_21180 [Myxococcus fulvus]SEU00342.1 hypothetical protein SAMN05443572_104294 [Myxococcus fulvus]
MSRIPSNPSPSFVPTPPPEAEAARPTPPAPPPPPPPPPPTPRYQKQGSGFEAEDSRKSDIRKWAAKNGDTAGAGKPGPSGPHATTPHGGNSVPGGPANGGPVTAGMLMNGGMALLNGPGPGSSLLNGGRGNGGMGRLDGLPGGGRGHGGTALLGGAGHGATSLSGGRVTAGMLMNGGMSLLGGANPVRGGGQENGGPPLLGGTGNSGLVSRGGGPEGTTATSRAQIAPGLTGADAYAQMQTLSTSATAAQQAVDASEVQLANDLALLGPTLTTTERDAYIAGYREQNAGVYAARDAAVADFAAHLEANGDALTSYLAEHHEGSPYTTSAAADPLFQGLALVADSPRASAAVDFLASNTPLMTTLASGAGFNLEAQVYGPALNATMADALAKGQTPEQAVAASRALIDAMPPSVQASILGPNPQATLDTLSRAVTGDVAALTALSTHAATQGSAGAMSLVTSALSVAMFTRPEVFSEPNVLLGITGPLSKVGMGATAVSVSLGTVASVLQRVTSAAASKLPGLDGVAQHTTNLAAAAPDLAKLVGKANNILGMVTASLNVVELLSRQEQNQGTHIQVAVQAASVVTGALSFAGILSGVPGMAVAATLFVLNQIGQARESYLRDEEVRRAVTERATAFGIPDAAARVEFVSAYPSQARDLAALGLDFPRMRDLVTRGLTDTGGLREVAQAFDLEPSEIDRMLELIAPEGQTTLADSGVRTFLNYFEQAQAALPNGTPEQLAAWMRQNPPPPTHGGGYYTFVVSMTNLLTSSP